MITIPTEDQVEARLETLPENLRDALFSIEITNLGESIGLSNGLKDGDIPSLAEVIAWVLMGFTHPSNAAQAIEEHVGADSEKARIIGQEIDQKIFSRYKTDLEKIYTPMKIRPAGMADISMTPAPVKTQMAPATMPINPMSLPPMPTPVNPGGMSALKTPIPTATIKEEPKGWQPTKLPVAEPTPIANATPISTATPAPFMMHQESSASPLATSSDFKLNISKDMFKSGPAKQIEIPRPPKAAELEIGKAPLPPKPAGSASFKTSPTMQSRVVHYTDLRTGMAPGFPAAQPMPKIAPATPTPAMPAMKTMSAPVQPIPTMPPMPKPPEPIKTTMPPSAPMPIAPAPIGQASSPTTSAAPTAPTPMKPPKVVNFGPEEVK